MKIGQPDTIKKWQYVLILLLAGVAGFIEGAVLDHVTNKNFLLVGVFLTWLGVYSLIGSRVLKKHRDELVAAGKTPIDRLMYNCGWIALILGVIAQIIGIWR